MNIRVLCAITILVSVTGLVASDSTSLDAFHKQAIDRSRLSKEAKNHTFFLHVFISGGWGPEIASYEVRYDGTLENLHPAKGAEVTGVIIRRDLKGETRVQLDKYSLSALVTQCIDQELFELGPKKHAFHRPEIKTDGCDLWIFIKYGDSENFFHRTDDSAPVNAVYHRVKTYLQPAEASQNHTPTKS
ncbi:MAG: hypothetical protein QM760_01940 [Nibricoccus sp.]